MSIDFLSGLFKRLSAAGRSARAGSCCGSQCSVRLMAAKDVPEGRGVCAEADGLKLAVFRQGEKFFALANSCSHLGGPLCKGEVAEGSVKCPWHGAKFSLTSGEVVGGPAKTGVTSFELEVRGEDLYVKKGRCGDQTG